MVVFRLVFVGCRDFGGTIRRILRSVRDNLVLADDSIC
jgi:hypothetical protein